MPKEYSRTLRVGDQIRRELAELLREELKDPRVRLVTINDCEVSRDLSHARVYVTTMDREHPQEEVVAALNHAAGFLRRELGRRMHIRTVPRLRFIYDETLDRAERIDRLLDEVGAAEGPDGQDPD